MEAGRLHMGQSQKIKCQFHDDCDEEVVAKIGLPKDNAIWTCKGGFDEWRRGREPHNYALAR